MRTRNQLGFHWDSKIVGPIVGAFGKNKQIVWMEATDEDSVPVHRLAADVLAHALVSDTDVVAKGPATQQAASHDLESVGDAINVIMAFFTAATVGYLKVTGAVRHERKSDQRQG